MFCPPMVLRNSLCQTKSKKKLKPSLAAKFTEDGYLKAPALRDLGGIHGIPVRKSFLDALWLKYLNLLNCPKVNLKNSTLPL